MLKIAVFICLLLGLALCDSNVTLNCVSCTGGICLTSMEEGSPPTRFNFHNTPPAQTTALLLSPSSTTSSAMGPAQTAKYRLEEHQFAPIASKGKS